jgi:hypothetical protein
MADAHDLGSCLFGGEGSSPSFPIVTQRRIPCAFRVHTGGRFLIKDLHSPTFNPHIIKASATQGKLP